MPAEPEASSAVCAKCGTAIAADRAACPGCGLAVARMAAYAAARDAEAPEPVQRAWTRATEHWDDTAHHDELFRLIVANNCYAWAAGRYRTRAADPIAVRQLDRLRRAAEVTMLASAAVRPDPGARPYRAAIAVLGILVILIVAGLLYAAIRDRGASSGQLAPGIARPPEPGHPIGSSTIK